MYPRHGGSCRPGVTARLTWCITTPPRVRRSLEAPRRRRESRRGTWAVRRLIPERAKGQSQRSDSDHLALAAGDRRESEQSVQ